MLRFKISQSCMLPFLRALYTRAFSSKRFNPARFLANPYKLNDRAERLERYCRAGITPWTVRYCCTPYNSRYRRTRPVTDRSKDLAIGVSMLFCSQQDAGAPSSHQTQGTSKSSAIKCTLENCGSPFGEQTKDWCPLLEGNCYCHVVSADGFPQRVVLGKYLA
jgi:hypothetical protein